MALPRKFASNGTTVWCAAVAAAMLVALAPAPAQAQLDKKVREAVVPAAVQIAALVLSAEGTETGEQIVPLGSGTIVSPDGLILTNHHVVDLEPLRAHVQTQQNQAARNGRKLSLWVPDLYLVLGSSGKGPPERKYTATLDAENDRPEVDLAVLRITGGAYGQSLDSEPLNLKYVPFGDSDALNYGDPLHLFGFPVTAGGTLTYSQGTVGNFDVQAGIVGWAWINSDAKVSGGSSGGTAVDDRGRLVGVPTRATDVECRSADTNGDGSVDESDFGCVPFGDSFARLRPIKLAIERIPALHDFPIEVDPIPTPTPTQSPTSEPTSTPTPTPTATVTPDPTPEPAECSTLLTKDDSGAVVPGLAEAWSISEDGQSWTLYLRRDVRLPDGSPFTSRVVTNIFQTLISAGELPIVIASVEEIDDYSVQFNLNSPSTELSQVLSDPSYFCVDVA